MGRRARRSAAGPATALTRSTVGRLPLAATLAATAVLALAPALAGCGGGGSGSSGGGDRPTNALGVPLTPGGDNTIQAYGHEAGAAQRRQVAATLKEYVAARRSDDWKRACALMSPELLGDLAVIAGKSSRLEGKPCATIAALVDANLPRQSNPTPPDDATPELVSLRVKGADAIAIYTARDRFYYLPFDLDHGRWEVSELNGSALLE
jgi:hypothetical protein